jgi:hypothetical protein
VNHGLYRTAVQPMVQAMATEQGSEWLLRMHPLRLGYETLSDRNPAMAPLASAAEEVKENRQPVSAGNPFLQWEKLFSGWMTASLNAYADWRDMMMEQMFFGIYGQSWLQAMLGLRASDDPPRKHPGEDPEQRAFVQRRMEELKADMEKGGPHEAAIRALVYIRMPENAVDERGFEMIRRIRAERCAHRTLPEFKQDLREQYLMLRLDERRAVEAIPAMLKGHEGEARELLDDIRRIVTAGGPLGEEAQKRLSEVERLFGASAPAPKKSAKEAH